MTCERPGCNRPRMWRERGGYRRYCSIPCHWWLRAWEALSAGGASLGRDAETDRVLFAGILALGLDDPNARRVLNELNDAYGRA
jgi:hypothetical protein